MKNLEETRQIEHTDVSNITYDDEAVKISKDAMSKL